jgi:hypothetical protein
VWQEAGNMKAAPTRHVLFVRNNMTRTRLEELCCKKGKAAVNSTSKQGEELILWTAPHHSTGTARISFPFPTG